ncbi:hypothetical protein Pelo_17978 [Pelomyxa schiedti]|nr:hypothetical protein Pelo_17978 [Pelomyxa schiedti]
MGQVVASHECDETKEAIERERKRGLFHLHCVLDARRRPASYGTDNARPAVRRIITKLACSVIDGGKLDKEAKLAAKTPPHCILYNN